MKSWKSYGGSFELHFLKLTEIASAYVMFRFPPPLFRTYWCEVLSRNGGGVEKSFQRVIEDQIHFVLTRNECVEDRRICEQPDGRSDDELLRREEWWKCDDRSEMRRLNIEGDLLESFSILRMHRASGGKKPQEQWDVQRSRPAIRQSRHTFPPVKRSGPGASGVSLTGS